jgi:hypothetical protein
MVTEKMFRDLLDSFQDAAEYHSDESEWTTGDEWTAADAIVALGKLQSDSQIFGGNNERFLTTRQLRYLASKAGLDAEEIKSVLSELDTVSYAVTESNQFDGNTVKKAGSRRGHLRKIERKVPVQIWLSGEVSREEEERLRSCISDLLIDADIELVDYDPPVRGSFFQALKFFGSFGDKYFKSLLSNLKSAFASTATRSQVEAVRELSEILQKHDDVVIRVDSLIAIKVSRAKVTALIESAKDTILPQYLNQSEDKSVTLITVITPQMEEYLSRNPSCFGQPEALLLLMYGKQVYPFPKPVGNVKSIVEP